MVVQTGQYETETVNKFIYLKSMINDTNTEKPRNSEKIKLCKWNIFLFDVFKSQNIHRKTKIQKHKTIIKPGLMYGS
jgi:hypothetical protein